MKMKDKHEIIVIIDGKEPFTSAKGRITRLCHECNSFGQLHPRDRELIEDPTYVRDSKRTFFILVTHDLLNFIQSGGSTTVNEYTISDHRCFVINIDR